MVVNSTWIPHICRQRRITPTNYLSLWSKLLGDNYPWTPTTLRSDAKAVAYFPILISYMLSTISSYYVLSVLYFCGSFKLNIMEFYHHWRNKTKQGLSMHIALWNLRHPKLEVHFPFIISIAETASEKHWLHSFKHVNEVISIQECHSTKIVWNQQPFFKQNFTFHPEWPSMMPL